MRDNLWCDFEISKQLIVTPRELMMGYLMSDFQLTIPESVLACARISRDRLEPEPRKELAQQLFIERGL